MGLIGSIITFLNNLFWKIKDFLRYEERTGEKYLGQFVDELPSKNEIEDDIIYIVGEKDYEWLVAFKCPCGREDLIQLNLLEDGRHVWRIVRRDPRKISLIPSVDRKIGCGSHFTVINGQVVWWGAKRG